MFRLSIPEGNYLFQDVETLANSETEPPSGYHCLRAEAAFILT